MFKILIILLLMGSDTAFSCETQKNISLAKSLFTEVNLIRRQPIQYVQLAKTRWKNSPTLRNTATALCKSPQKAQNEFDKAILLLNKQKPISAYRKDSNLTQIACDIVSDMAQKDQINPLYENYNSFFKSHLRSKNYEHSLSVSSGLTHGRDIVIRFLIGDCLFTNSHGLAFTKDNLFWKNIFSKKFDKAGSACSFHPLSQFDGPKVMCAHTVLKEKGSKIIKTGYQKGFEEL